MPVRRAVIFIRPNGPRSRQERACLAYCDRHGYVVVGVTADPSQAIAMTEQRTVDRVVVAYEAAGDADRELITWVKGLGGEVEYTRSARGRRRFDVAALVRRLRSKGMNTREVAVLVDLPSGEIRQMLGPAGDDDRPPKTHRR